MQTYQNQQGMNQQPAPMGLSDQELAYDLLYQEKALMANHLLRGGGGQPRGPAQCAQRYVHADRPGSAQVFQILNEQGLVSDQARPAA